MKKSSFLVTCFAAFACAIITWFPTASAKAQCTPFSDAVGNFDLTYAVYNEESVTRIRLFLDYGAPVDEGAYGFHLQIALTSGIEGVSDVGYTLSGSWLFASTSASVDVDYNAVTHAVSFDAQRLDCMGDKGDGFIGEVIFEREEGIQAAVQCITGSIVMVDNVDAG